MASEPDLPPRPWIPPSLEGQVDGEQLCHEFGYVVVEEIVLDQVRTVLSPWPRLAPDGQLRFADPEAVDEYVDARGTIERLLEERRILAVTDEATLQAELRQRAIETGDAYAVLAWPGSGGGRGGGGGGGGGGAPRSLAQAVLAEVIYDITADVRLAATATYASATGGALESLDAKRFFDDDEGGPHNEGGAPAPRPEGPSPSRGGGDKLTAEPEFFPGYESLAEIFEKAQGTDGPAPPDLPSTAGA